MYTESAKKAVENADAAGTYRHRTISGGMGQKRATEDLGLA